MCCCTAGRFLLEDGRIKGSLSRPQLVKALNLQVQQCARTCAGTGVCACELNGLRVSPPGGKPGLDLWVNDAGLLGA